MTRRSPGPRDPEPAKRRDAAAVRVFPPGVPLLAILLGEGLDRWRPIPLGIQPPPTVRHTVGWVVVIGAILFLGFWSVWLIRRSGQSENPWKPTLAIVERGPFRVTRNPMYLQMVIACIGIAILSWNVWILLLTPLVAVVLERFAIRPEEAYLTRKFGDPYVAYTQRVRRWI